jgi:hypothetical protein
MIEGSKDLITMVDRLQERIEEYKKIQLKLDLDNHEWYIAVIQQMISTNSSRHDLILSNYSSFFEYSSGELGMPVREYRSVG